MIRESLTGSSSHVGVRHRAAAGGMWRASTGARGPVGGTAPPGGMAGPRQPIAVTAAGRRAVDAAGTVTVPMTTDVYVGLAVTSQCQCDVDGDVHQRQRDGVGGTSPNGVDHEPGQRTTFAAPATITINATAATRRHGEPRRVLPGDDVAGHGHDPPATWNASGTYSLTARAPTTPRRRPLPGSDGRTVQSRRRWFQSSSDHAQRQLPGAVPRRGSTDRLPWRRATRKPAVVINDLVDISITVNVAGWHYAVVTAIGPGGSTASAPATFTK